MARSTASSSSPVYCTIAVTWRDIVGTPPCSHLYRVGLLVASFFAAAERFPLSTSAMLLESMSESVVSGASAVAIGSPSVHLWITVTP